MRRTCADCGGAGYRLRMMREPEKALVEEPCAICDGAGSLYDDDGVTVRVPYFTRRFVFDDDRKVAAKWRR